MSKPLAILLVGAVLLQTLLGAVAGAGTICLGGGHEHPVDAPTAGCDLDCSHATGRTVLPVLVESSHVDCGCADIDLSVSEWLGVLPRGEDDLLASGVVQADLQPIVLLIQWQSQPCLPKVPSWFDPGGTRTVSHLLTIRLIV